MRPLIWIAPIALLGGCARPAEPASAGLARELANYVPGQAESCISSFANQNLRVIDARTIAYGSGRTVYVNHLAGALPRPQPVQHGDRRHPGQPVLPRRPRARPRARVGDPRPVVQPGELDALSDALASG